MATNSMVPYSNPAGHNQLTPPIGGANSGAAVSAPISTAVPATATSTALQPFAAASSNPLVPATASVPTAGLPGTNIAGTGGNSAQQDKQEVDIYGKGVGGDINNLLNSIGGVDSATLQEYTASLQPQEATAQANLNASLGAAGVGANSSVAALGDANLQAQETAAIAGESAQLTQSGQNLEASILQGQQGAAAKEVSESGWNVFGQVLEGVGNVAGAAFGDPGAGSQMWGGLASGANSPGNLSGTPSAPFESAVSSVPSAPPPQFTNWDSTGVGTPDVNAGGW